MRDTASRAHVLQIPCLNDRAVAHAIPMLQLTLNDVGEDLHVRMWMCGETAVRLHRIVVDHAQRFESHVIGVKVLAKGEREPRLQPPVVGRAAFACWTFGEDR